jgi:transposase
VDHYDPSRGQAVARNRSQGFKVLLQTDGFEVRGAIATDGRDIRHVGCFAQVRRKFGEAGKAQMGLALIQWLYAVERRLTEAEPEPEAPRRERQRQAQPILEELLAWLECTPPEVPPSTLIDKAAAYLHHQSPEFCSYLGDGRPAIGSPMPPPALAPRSPSAASSTSRRPTATTPATTCDSSSPRCRLPPSQSTSPLSCP